MNNPELQLMVYGSNLTGVTVLSENENLQIVDIIDAGSSNYLFVDILITESAQAGDYNLIFNKDGFEPVELSYTLLERNKDSSAHKGFDNRDVIYLIMPDRFSDGDPGNNMISGFEDKTDRENPLARHGGDLQGVINHLDYLNDLGITAIWLTPVIENNTSISYHGYSATDHYKIDPRLGSNLIYKKLVDEAHKRGLKVIFDHVSNHISIDHPWIEDLPFNDWIHGSPDNHLPAMHDKMIYSDVHGDSLIRKFVSDGWFTSYMPDLNQRNPFLAKYLIQNTIWWIEFAGIDGIREDTYPYNDQEFLAQWAEAVFSEYPEFNIVGEVWTGEPAFLAYYQKGSRLRTASDTNLPSVTDFAVRDALYGYMSGTGSLYELYTAFAKDYLYPDPSGLMIFGDNHDIARLMYYAGGNAEKVKNVLTVLLTSRGIPQILYGDEIGMVGGEEHGLLRSDFPGGFPGDERNAFIHSERTAEENELFSFIKNLLELRKLHPALSCGNMIHLPPFLNCYIYFKESGKEKFMIIINGDEEGKEINLSMISERFPPFSYWQDIFTGQRYESDSLIIPVKPDGRAILRLQK